MSDQASQEDIFNLELNGKEQKVLRTALRSLAGIVSSREPRDFSQQELDSVRALRARLPE